jgi:hypothetical protein
MLSILPIYTQFFIHFHPHYNVSHIFHLLELKKSLGTGISQASINRQLQQDAALLGVQDTASNTSGALKWRHSSVLRTMAVDDNGTIVLDNITHSGSARGSPPASSHTGQNQTLGTGRNGGSDKSRAEVLVAVQDSDLWQNGGGGEVEIGLSNGQGGLVVEFGLDVVKVAEVALLDSLEGVEQVGVGLGGVVGAGDAVVQHDHGTAAHGGGGGGESDGLEEVDGPVGGDGRGGTHGADQDNGLLGADGHGEEEGRLLEGIGTVGDDDALGVWRVQGGLDLVRQVEQDLGGDVVRVDVGDLNALDVGYVDDAGHGIDENLDAQGTRRVTGCLRGGRGGAGNGSTRGEDGDVGERGIEGGGPGEHHMRLWHWDWCWCREGGDQRENRSERGEKRRCVHDERGPWTEERTERDGWWRRNR